MADGPLRLLLADCLSAGIPATLLAVVASEDSSPGKPGAKLVLAADGRVAGTVGGGLMEQGLIEAAPKLLREAAPRLLRFRHDTGSGMVCGGRQTVALIPCAPSELPAVLDWHQAEQSQTPGCLRLSPLGLAFDRHRPTGPAFSQSGADDWLYQESVACGPHAFLIGGGHVSLALSQVLALLDFRVNVLEQRDNIGSFIGNRHAHGKTQVDYATLAELIPEGDTIYAVVMTHAHTLDEKVLRQLLDKKLRYLGMLGSRRKAAATMANLARDFPADWLARVHAPAGLPIGSHSPAEIAVSIAAEMVAVKNGVA